MSAKKSKQNNRSLDWLNFGYGLGAAIVILGAMFKFLGWNYADQMFLIGLTAEALIFVRSGIEFKQDDYEELKWEKVFPQLHPDYKGGSDSEEFVFANESYLKETKKLVKSISTLTDVVSKLSAVTNSMESSVSKIGTSIDNIKESSSLYEKELEELRNNVKGLNSFYAQSLMSAQKAAEQIAK